MLLNYDYREAMKLANQLCFPLYAAARNVTGLYTPWLKPLGLTYTQYIVLLVLWEKDGISVTEIGERLMLDNGTLSPLLKKLEQAGYITRQRDREDERVVIIRLTEDGRALQEKARDVLQEAKDFAGFHRKVYTANNLFSSKRFVKAVYAQKRRVSLWNLLIRQCLFILHLSPPLPLQFRLQNLLRYPTK